MSMSDLSVLWLSCVSCRMYSKELRAPEGELRTIVGARLRIICSSGDDEVVPRAGELENGDGDDSSWGDEKGEEPIGSCCEFVKGEVSGKDELVEMTQLPSSSRWSKQRSSMTFWFSCKSCWGLGW